MFSSAVRMESKRSSGLELASLPRSTVLFLYVALWPKKYALCEILLRCCRCCVYETPDFFLPSFSKLLNGLWVQIHYQEHSFWSSLGSIWLSSVEEVNSLTWRASWFSRLVQELTIRLIEQTMLSERAVLAESKLPRGLLSFNALALKVVRAELSS